MRFVILLFALLAAAYGIRELSKSTTFQIAGEVVARVTTDQPVIALTFDDGPSAKNTQTLLDALALHGATATFYLVGKDIAANPNAARAIHEAGHEIGNHSWAHDRLIFRSRASLRAELARTDAELRAIGYEGPLTFRPPYGQRLLNLPRVLAEEGRPTIMWSLAPEGQTDDLAGTIIAEAQPGDIVLLHGMWSGNADTRAALPAILDGLSARGFRFVTVSELLALNVAVQN